MVFCPKNLTLNFMQIFFVRFVGLNAYLCRGANRCEDSVFVGLVPSLGKWWYGNLWSESAWVI
jgi:hypothetical protein